MAADCSVSPKAGQTMGWGLLWGAAQQAKAKPVNTSPPLITAAVAGVVAVYVPGIWTGADTVSVEWFLNGVDTGISGILYVGSIGNIGAILTVQETASNSGGSTVVVSAGIAISL